MTQLTLDAAQGQRLKADGLAQVEGDAEFLRIMRTCARGHAILHGQVTTDHLRVHAERLGIAPRSPHTWGAILRGKGWICIGRQPSTLPSNHARFINVYRWEGA